MKLNLASVALALALPAAMYGQDSIAAPVTPAADGGVQNALTSSASKSKRFNDWAVSAGGGAAIMKTGSLNSIRDKKLIGWTGYFSIDKALTHAFGLKLQYDKGETRQGDVSTKDHVPGLGGRTQYDAISLLGDLNFSNLFRRVDSRSAYRWALHGYVGAGTLAYRSYLQEPGQKYNQSLTKEVKPFKFNSFFAQLGGGLKYKLTNSIDLEGRLMWLISGDDQFDGSRGDYINPAKINQNDVMTGTLGLTYNIGKHQSHLFWHDPLQEIYYKLDIAESRNQDIQVCKKGDADNDGVCDDWDRELNTPAGARVDGSGRALDTDLDGVIDLYDKCVTVPGPASNNGCPIDGSGNFGGQGNGSGKNQVATEVSRKLEGIEFDLNSDRILSSNREILNSAVNYINSSNTGTRYTVVGTTDTRGKAQYNKVLSQRRANNVKSYLIRNGVSASKLNAIGRGKSDLKYPECNPASKCPEWKNRANRRVYFQQR
ncbi:OmpA family protein [Elizabethkingia argentiflava]|uniref:OmpA family protein n=1 Tax=Elizabethkingia argenteiflava TaxID=2681556 RepID=A0A845PWF0_9FLAO|nr:OmpA family protein [Elizabethkingia argenteiflava]NAW51955.1 OmpA family protein [Elizabethkingia argenteiflava]